MKNLRYFQQNFPVFDSKSPSSFFSWYARIIRHCQDMGGFVPPAHTLRDGNPLGIWFDALPPWVKAESQNRFHGLLATCLKSKNTGLLSDPATSAIVLNHENGYWILHDLAQFFGHPLLQRFPTPLTEPVQAADCALSLYLGLWSKYLHLKAIQGTILSDRYFFQQVVRHMHEVLRPILGQYLEQDNLRFPIGTALPHSFSPERLLMRLSSQATYLGNPKLIHDPPRTLFRASPVQALTLPSSSSPLPDELLVAAMSNSRACFLCSATDHMAGSCPMFQKIRENPVALRFFQRQFTTRPPVSSPSDRRIRALGTIGDEPPLPGDSSGEGDPLLADPTNNEPSDEVPDEPSDFQ